eukprot:1161676-Pelagomonas_calceolata.AAC.12
MVLPGAAALRGTLLPFQRAEAKGVTAQYAVGVSSFASNMHRHDVTEGSMSPKAHFCKGTVTLKNMQAQHSDTEKHAGTVTLKNMQAQ